MRTPSPSGSSFCSTTLRRGRASAVQASRWAADHRWPCVAEAVCRLYSELRPSRGPTSAVAAARPDGDAGGRRADLGQRADLRVARPPARGGLRRRLRARLPDAGLRGRGHAVPGSASVARRKPAGRRGHSQLHEPEQPVHRHRRVARRARHLRQLFLGSRRRGRSHDERSEVSPVRDHPRRHSPRRGASVAVVTAKDKLRTAARPRDAGDLLLVGAGRRGHDGRARDRRTCSGSSGCRCRRSTAPISASSSSRPASSSWSRPGPISCTSRPPTTSSTSTRPGTPQANDFYRMMDGYLAELDAHGRDDRADGRSRHERQDGRDDGVPQVIYLQDVLDGWLGAGRARVILPITDPYVVHHGALGSFATVYLPEGADAGAAAAQRRPRCRAWSWSLDREEGCRRFELPPDRMGDLIAISGAARRHRHERGEARPLGAGRAAPLTRRAHRADGAAGVQPAAGGPAARRAAQKLRHLRSRAEPRAVMPFPRHARVVIVGGGIVGTSVAYHLAKLGWTRRGAARAGQPLRRHHVACGGPRGPAARLEQPDPAHPLQRRPLRPARGRDGPGDGLEALRQPLAWRARRERMIQLERNAALARSYGIDAEVDQRQAGGGALPAHAHRRPGRAPSGSRATARPTPPTSPRPSPRARGPAARRSTRASRSPASGSSAARVAGVETSQGAIATEIARQLRGHVGARARPA